MIHPFVIEDACAIIQIAVESRKRFIGMKVVLEPVSGTAKDNLERAKLEIERVLAFRGSVTSVKAKGKAAALSAYRDAERGLIK